MIIYLFAFPPSLPPTAVSISKSNMTSRTNDRVFLKVKYPLEDACNTGYT